MGLDERLGWMLFGCVIGFILGYIVRYLREIKEELDEVDDIVKERRFRRRANDDGFMRVWLVRDLAVLIVVIFTVWAAFTSANASKDVRDQQDRIDSITVCTSEYLARTIRVLNIRTDAVQERADANLELQKAQAKFFGLLLKIPPIPEGDRRAAADEYLKALDHFVEVSNKTKNDGKSDPYPTNAELSACIDNHGGSNGLQ